MIFRHHKTLALAASSLHRQRASASFASRIAALKKLTHEASAATAKNSTTSQLLRAAASASASSSGPKASTATSSATAAAATTTTTTTASPAAHTTIPEGAIGYCERVIVGYSARKIYDLVADVEQYEAFLPWCVASTVGHVDRNSGGDPVKMTAAMRVGFSLFKQQYRSDVTFDPPCSKITARLTGETGDELLEYLECEWVFNAESATSTDVEFEVVFKFRNPLHQELSSLVLSQVVETMVSLFVLRCGDVYGPPSLPLKEMQIRDPSRHNADELPPASMPSLTRLMQLI
eukprot:Rhum_TRINITY_DN12374_c1_g1::Rhum_TRINITY_DN12374_c1_g1_i1::g.51421::m.51421/K18588/COQ10; coenzyme Q-binding protein COQ10